MAAKTVRLALAGSGRAATDLPNDPDSSAVWNTLPGGTGSFNEEAESIEDTIFGQAYGSTEVGLITWTLGANAYFKGFPGYRANISQQGTSTAFASGDSRTLTQVGSTKVYRHDDDDLSIWDSGTVPVFEDSAAANFTSPSDIAATNVKSIDYLMGTVEFASSYTVKAHVRIKSGKYFKRKELGRAQTYTLTMTKDAIDNTYFGAVKKSATDHAVAIPGAGGYRTFEPGLRTVQVELGGIFDINAGLSKALRDRSLLILEIDPAGDGSTVFRGFFKHTATGQSGDVGALETQNLTTMLQVPSGKPTVFGVLHRSTTLHASVQNALTHWFDDSKKLWAQYLPEGTVGNSPKDGKQGQVMVTDMSLSGGLSDMNMFSVSMQGIGTPLDV